MIEKPFGTTLLQARELNRRVLAILDETQVFRIAPYLGKGTMQYMLAIRYAHGRFARLWNRNSSHNAQSPRAEATGAGAPRAKGSGPE